MDFERIDSNGWTYEYATAASPEFSEDVRVVLHVDIDRLGGVVEAVKVLIVNDDVGCAVEVGTGEINPKDTPHLYKAVCEVEEFAGPDTQSDVDDYIDAQREHDHYGER